MSRVDLPHHPPTDLLICGSTLAACDLAIRAARAGIRTTLAMEKVNPWFEGVSCLRSWIDLDDGDLSSAPDLLRPVFENPDTTECIGRQLYFNPAKAILALEDGFCDAGVRFFYNISPAMALRAGDRLTGIVFGGKTGLFAIQARAIVDGTAPHSLARLCGLPFSQGGKRRIHATVELSKPAAPRRFHRDEPGLHLEAEVHHRFISYTATLAHPATGPMASIHDFRAANRAILAAPLEGDEVRFRGADGWLATGHGTIQGLGASGRADAFPNLLVLGGGAWQADSSSLLTAPFRDSSENESRFELIADLIAKAPAPWGDGMDAPPASASVSRGESFKVPSGTRIGLRDPGFDEPESKTTAVDLELPMPALQETLVIAGAGTSGIAAAWQACRQHIPALCLDRGLEPGGTNTLGGVTNLWYGTDTPAFRHFYESVGATNNGLNAVPFAKALDRVGVPFIPGLALTGVLHESGRITHLLAVGPDGLVMIRGDLFIDATGDGALAAWAGAPYTFGGMSEPYGTAGTHPADQGDLNPSRPSNPPSFPRAQDPEGHGMAPAILPPQDETTLWGSFAYFKAGAPEARRPFLSPCDERSPGDVTRFIVAMRRNAKVDFEVPHTPPPFYLAPRESRHIQGGATVTYLDVLAGRKYRRGILRARSNLDIKGIATSAAARAGFIPEYWLEVFSVTVPYDALVPPSVPNCLIAGKAYSIEHDALAMARMQKDLFVMGLAAAEAARLAMANGNRFGSISVPDLQTRLMELGALTKDDLSPDDYGFETDPGRLTAEIADAPSLDKALIPSARLALLDRGAATKALATHPNGENENLARIRCFLGMPYGAAQVLATFKKALGEGLPPQEIYCGKASTPHIMPDQGYAPLPALLLGNLTAAGTPALAEAIALLAPRMDLASFQDDARWGYLFALTNACEAMPSAKWIPFLEGILASPILEGLTVPRTEDPRRAKDPIRERRGYLRLATARALTRCGSPAGRGALSEFQQEIHTAWARSALRLLAKG